MDSGDGCPAMWRNICLEMATMISFMLYIYFTTVFGVFFFLADGEISVKHKKGSFSSEFAGKGI